MIGIILVDDYGHFLSVDMPPPPKKTKKTVKYIHASEDAGENGKLYHITTCRASDLNLSLNM